MNLTLSQLTLLTLGTLAVLSLPLPAEAQPEPKVRLFPLEDVRLLPGPFFQAQETNRAWLLRVEPDRMLHHMHKAAGLPVKARPYGGWEKNIAGQIGHYLSACASMARATGDTELRRLVDYIVSEMAACQKANGDGAVYEGE